MAPRRRRASRAPQHRYAIAVAVFLLASAALFVILLASTTAPPDGPGTGPAAAPAPTSAAGSTPAGPSATPAPPPAPTEVPLSSEISVLEPNYTVESGDTLGSIAREHGTTVIALIELNRLDDEAVLNIGQRLYVPSD